MTPRLTSPRPPTQALGGRLQPGLDFTDRKFGPGLRRGDDASCLSLALRLKDLS